eukprot:TRINITY_DN7707_c0_g1_i1.p1 TRINITY_DN7707_c0_g1~~TRINITY_DN7707_c0_g1_i1.p1  ORF type:complete len:432 (-),score=43.62 TRINITY_DN7707_c0_g1_i1:1001-2296(-)
MTPGEGMEDAKEMTEEERDMAYFRNEWPKYPKHTFILSSAGKPIYSRHGDEQKLCSFMGVLQLLISHVVESKDSLQTIYAGSHKFVFLCKGPLYFVAISALAESAAYIRLQLEYMHSQIVSSLTQSVITQVFKTRPQYDIRGLLGDTTKFVHTLNLLLEKNPDFISGVFMQATHCLRLKLSTRITVSDILNSVSDDALVFAILIGKNQLISIVRPKGHELYSSDLHLILNSVQASKNGVKKGDSRTSPVCLPAFNERGYLHAYVYRFTDDISLLLLSTAPGNLVELKDKIESNLISSGALKAIHLALKRDYLYEVAEVRTKGLLHFAYKNRKSGQVTSPKPSAPYKSPADQLRIFKLYQQIHLRMQSGNYGTYYLNGERERIIGWIENEFVLFASFSRFIPISDALDGCSRVLRWIKGQEEDLFILQAPVW